MSKTIKIEKDALVNLLKKVQRKATYNGKTNPQVESCTLSLVSSPHGRYHLLSVTSLVKDGVSSIARFKTKINLMDFGMLPGSSNIPVPDIETLLGILKFHGKQITLLYDEEMGKTRIRSGKKVTTLATNPNALAYLSSLKTLEEWHEDSIAVAKKIDATIGTYTIPQTAKWSAETIGPFDAYYSISTTDLFEALRCDGMNGKKSGRYTFRLDYNQTDNGKLSIETGDDIKGKTSVAIMGTEGQFGDRKEHFKGTKRDDIPTFTTIDLVFEGGLEESMKLMNGTVDIYFLHFTGRKGAGEYAMIISDGGPDPSFIFQTSLESTWKKR